MGLGTLLSVAISPGGGALLDATDKT